MLDPSFRSTPPTTWDAMPRPKLKAERHRILRNYFQDLAEVMAEEGLGEAYGPLLASLGLGPEAGAGAGAGRALGSEKHSCSLLLRQLHLVMMVHITDATPELAPPNWHHLLGIT